MTRAHTHTAHRAHGARNQTVEPMYQGRRCPADSALCVPLRCLATVRVSLSLFSLSSTRKAREMRATPLAREFRGRRHDERNTACAPPDSRGRRQRARGAREHVHQLQVVAGA